jgi:dihydrofolate synthase/folylpolyglutamate synthase
MNLDETMAYIHSTSWRGSELGLKRVTELLGLMGNPHQKLRYVHAAGTNGKGSTCAMLASVLAAAGYKTGLYTSPFINRFNERMQVNGKPIDDAALIRVTELVRQSAEKMPVHPTEFELITAIAFQYFLESQCDVVVLEVGLGGRLDATNVIPVPEVAVITPISLDHVEQLGDTAEKIAVEKAGIIKPGGCAVSAPQVSGVAHTLLSACAERNADITFVDARDVTITRDTLYGQLFNYKQYTGLEISLVGAFQPENAGVVITAAECLRAKGWQIRDSDIYKGLKQTRWPARFEIVQENPYVIVDGGHNPQCAECLAENLRRYFPGQGISFIVGVMADKDYEAMFAKILPFAKRIFTVTPDNPRALNARRLAGYFQKQGIRAVTACDSVEQGVRKALAASGKDDVICSLGSFYMAGAIRGMFGLS